MSDPTPNHAVQTSVAPGSAGPSLPLALYRFHFRAVDAISLPPYAGSAWRGVFGTALKHSVCVTREKDCAGCMLYRSCAYPYLFETPPNPEAQRMRKYRAAPHPYVLRPGVEAECRIPAGGPLSVDLALFGRGNTFLPFSPRRFAPPVSGDWPGPRPVRAHQAAPVCHRFGRLNHDLA